jgi:Fe2+ transport system protein FeoA
MFQVLAVRVRADLRHLVESLGLHAGEIIRVLHNDGRGTVMVERDSRWVLVGRKVSYHTEVHGLNPHDSSGDR